MNKFKIIYEPSGRAKEYADYALNIYNSCDFGCQYCYVPRVLHMDRQEFHTFQRARDGVLKKVEHDAPFMKGMKVLLCFTCDPYQSLDEELQLTRKVMEIFNRYGVNWVILTKGGTRACRDFDLYKPGDSFGSTLTLLPLGQYNHYWEPNAASPEDRFEALMRAHELSIKTWVSLEPVIYPADTLKIIEFTYKYVDLYKVGKLNSENSVGSPRYEELRKIEKSINWKDFGRKAEALLQHYGKEYCIKEDLRKAMER
jgi:DNA repair photolyase